MANNMFKSSTGTFTDAIPGEDEVASRLKDTATALGERASELGHGAVDAIDARRASAANGLDSAAAGVHRGADRLPANVSPLAHQAADKLGATADYMRDHTMQAAFSDLEEYVKAHPGQALLGAAVVGFWAGRMISRD